MQEPLHTAPCWRCGNPDAASPFCHYCNTLQPPVPDYFLFFGIPKQLSIDAAGLQKRFYELSRQLHPDRFVRGQELERRYSLEATALLNDGYRILKDPVLRSELILRENGFDIGEQRSKDVPPELLEEVFELNMALDELRGGDDDALDSLRASRSHFEALRAQIDTEMESDFRKHDAAQGEEARREVLGHLRGLLNRRRYIQNLLREVDKELETRATQT